MTLMVTKLAESARLKRTLIPTRTHFWASYKTPTLPEERQFAGELDVSSTVFPVEMHDPNVDEVGGVCTTETHTHTDEDAIPSIVQKKMIPSCPKNPEKLPIDRTEREKQRPWSNPSIRLPNMGTYNSHLIVQ